MDEAATAAGERARPAVPEGKARSRWSAEDVAWVGLWPTTLALFACFAWLAPPLSELIPDPVDPFFVEFQSAIKPEPLESMRFVFAVVAPIALVAAVLRFGSSAPAERRFDGAVILFQVAAIGLIAWGVVNQVDELPVVDPDYFAPLLLSVPVLVAGVAIGAVLSLLALSSRWPFDRLDGPTCTSMGWRVGAFAAALLLTALWLLPAVFTDANLSEAGLIPAGHVPVQAQDYFAVVNGRTPLVDYVAQYTQLLPLVFAPVLAAFDLSILSSSVLMVALSVLALLAIYGVFLKVTGRPLAALGLYIPFLALSLLPWSDDGLRHEFNGSYFAFFPGRYLGPFVVAWLCALIVSGRRLPVWLAFFAAGLAMLNNAEFGGICVLALFCGLALGAERGPRSWRTIRALLAQAAIGLLGATALVAAGTLARTGELPNPELLLYYTKLFARQSFGLEPMPALGLHIAVYVTFAAAILTAVVRYAQGQTDTTLTAMLGYAGVFGLLAGSYFAGRSLPWQLILLFPTWGLALALVTWTVVQYLCSARGGDSLRRLLLPSVASMVGFGVMIASVATISPPWDEVERLSRSGAAEADTPEVQRYVENLTEPGEEILLFGTLTDHRVAERAGVENVSPFSSGIALFSAREVERALDALEREGGTKIVISNPEPPERGNDPGSLIDLLFEKGFRPVDGTPYDRLVLFERR